MSEAIQNLFEEITLSESTTKLQDLINKVLEHTEDQKIIQVLENTADLIEKLLRKIVHKEKFVTYINKEENMVHIIKLVNHKNIRKLDLYGIYLRVLEYLESEKSSHYKLEFERKKFYENLVKESLVNPTALSEFTTDLFDIHSIEEYSEVMNSIFSYPNKVTNYLESCPNELKAENFYISILHCALQNLSTQAQEKKIDNFTYLLNKLILNGHSSKYE
jgi:hypothetical protein